MGVAKIYRAANRSSRGGGNVVAISEGYAKAEWSFGMRPGTPSMGVIRAGDIPGHAG